MKLGILMDKIYGNEDIEIFSSREEARKNEPAILSNRHVALYNRGGSRVAEVGVKMSQRYERFGSYPPDAWEYIQAWSHWGKDYADSLLGNEWYDCLKILKQKGYIVMFINAWGGRVELFEME